MSETAAPQGAALPGDFDTYLQLPLEERVRLRRENPSGVEALASTFFAARGLRTPNPGAAQPEAAPVPHVEFEAFRSYREFLAAPRALRDAYRQAHAATVQLWESEFASRTRVKVGLSS